MDRMPRTPVQPAIGIDVQTGVGEAWPGTIECTLRITAQARIGDSTAFLIEVTEAGIFELPAGTSGDELTRFASMTAPGILFPIARRDLAAMVTAAGFQPVVPDHVDFQEIAARVVKDRGLRLAPAPVAAAATQGAGAVATATPRANAQGNDPQAADTQPLDTRPEAPDTQPSFLDTQPVVPVATAAMPKAAPRRARGGLIAVAAIAVVLLAGGWWWSQREPVQEPVMDAPVPVARPAASPAPPAASASPAAPAQAATPKPAEASSATRRALEESRERLAALPPGWRSIELGQMDADADLRVLEVLPLQAPLYLVRLPGGQLQVLYGAFPSQEAAAAALEDTRGWKAQGLRGEPRIVVPGRAS